MGKAGRFACIFTPMALTIASLVCLVIVGLGGTNKSNAAYNNLYFFRANTSDITVSPSDLPSGLNIPSNPLTDGIADKAKSALGSVVQKELGIYDFYHVSLWNYCAGNFTSDTSNASVSDNVTYCSPHTNEFWFNPIEVWGLNNTGVDQFFSSELRSGLKTYQTVAKWMFIAYIVALISTIVEILVGFLALFSRLGSLATTIVSSISSLFFVAFALTSTILYSTLTGTFNDALTKYNIHGSLGRSIYITIWLGVAFSFASGLFWLLSSCCCSGRSDRIKGYGDDERGGRRGGGRHAYNRVESLMPPHPAQRGYQQAGPYQQQHHMGPVGGAARGQGQAQGQYTSYEPFRHV